MDYGIIQTWGDVLTRSFQNIGAQVISVLPNLILALIIFIAGWVVGSLVARLVAQIVNALKIDSALKSMGADELLQKAGFRLDSGSFLGGLVKLFVIFVFLVTALDVLGLSKVNEFLGQLIVGFIPNLIVVVVLMFVAAWVAELLSKLVVGSAKASEIPHAHFWGEASRWIIWIFAVLVALQQLGIGVGVINTFFLGIVSSVALAFGLAFGLGGRDFAAYYLEKLKREVLEK
jgi:small-conductance mechanosensitive channel